MRPEVIKRIAATGYRVRFEDRDRMKKDDELSLEGNLGMDESDDDEDKDSPNDFTREEICKLIAVLAQVGN